MQIMENVSLREHSTMRLGGKSRYAVEITERNQVAEAVAWAETRGVPVLCIGHGSNIVWQDEGFAGLLLINRIKHLDMFDEDGRNVYITAGSGEVWDNVVSRAVDEGLTGIECLSLIPGTAGAAPVQNIGAYGQELSEVLSVVELYDTHAKGFLNLPVQDCDFGYRTSRFKTTDHGRYIITAITLHLTRGLPAPPFYQALEEYLVQHNLSNPTPATVREAVIAVRRSKLPDPSEIANNGSFFANPVVDEGIAAQLRADFPDIPYWRVDDEHIKLPAAWLVEQAGFRDYHDSDTGMATWDKQALVFVNEHARTTADLLTFRQKVIDGVKSKFGVTLEQEPELLP